jgi:aspartate/methionine/tyrosine aminotransferase
MFSSRFSAASHEPSPLWEARQERLRSGAPLFDLTRSNPTGAGIPYPAHLPTLLARPDILRYAPDPRGLPEARVAVRDYLRARGRRCETEDLLLTASTSEAYAFLFKLLCDPGDEVLIPSPGYPLFDALSELEHVRLIRYPLRPPAAREAGSGGPTRWRGDLDFLRRVISTRTRALILVSPNNPTGHIADAEEWAACLDLAREHDLAVLVDEVFSEYLFGGAACPPLASDGPLVFVLNGLSKLAGLPQLKLGWIHALGAPDRVREALAHLEWIADAYLSVGTPVQAACADLLALAPAVRAPIQARLESNLAFASANAAGLIPLMPEGGWSLVVRVPRSRRDSTGFPGLSPAMDDESFCLNLLREQGVFVHPGSLFGFEENGESLHVVLSLLPQEDEFRQGFRRLAAHAGGSHG